MNPDNKVEVGIVVGDDFYTTEIKVRVTTTRTYVFPEFNAQCPAHGRNLCLMCARNPSTCATSDSPPCGFYSTTGMHWDTCPNRDRSPL